MALPSPYTPPRALSLHLTPGKVTLYESTGGAITSTFASHNLSLLPPIPSGSTIHDNACGAGTVSRLILSPSSTSPHVPEVTIYATDTDEPFLDTLARDTLKYTWPITISNQRAEALTFNDETFTHSITNMGIFLTAQSGLPAAREIYRTLRPGGTAVVNCWAGITWLLPFKLVHEALRPGVPYPKPPVLWNDGLQLQKVMVEAGFAAEKMRVERSEAWAKTRDIRGWAERSWAFLGGLGGWQASDEERWEEAVGLLVEKMMEQEGTKVVDGEVWMQASQWVVIAMK